MTGQGLEFINVTKTFKLKTGAKCVLSGVSFSMPPRRISVLLGPSGSGKTTILRLAAAFDKPDSGTMFLDGEEITKPSHKRFMVFQSFNQLFPWKSIEDNIIYALRSTRHVSADEARQISEYWLDETGLLEYRGELPSKLSGGMKQRAAIARAFSLDPSLLLLDEPFSALDHDNKMSVLELLRNLSEKNKTTVVFVTHDKQEAAYLSDSAYFVNDGCVIQPEQLL